LNIRANLRSHTPTQKSSLSASVDPPNLQTESPEQAILGGLSPDSCRGDRRLGSKSKVRVRPTSAATPGRTRVAQRVNNTAASHV